MAQNPLAVTIGKTPAGAQSTGKFDIASIFMASDGGVFSLLGVTIASVIKASSGRLGSVFVSYTTIPTGGALTLNDSATLGGANASNIISSIPGTGLIMPQASILAFDIPFLNGLVVSSVPTGGSGFTLSFGYS